MRPIDLMLLLGAGALSAAIVAAPAAFAAPSGPPPNACSSTGSGTECVTPGNAQINDTLPAVTDYYPYGGGLVLGGFGGHR
jgi:hypothetical protein